MDTVKLANLMLFLSTLSLRRATAVTRVARTPTIISIHALLAESDVFLNCDYPFKLFISIHALLAESDSRAKAIPAKIGYFYPRSPCGERLLQS